MSQPDLLALAHQGDEAAIAVLLHQVLPAKGLQVKTRLKHGSLQVLLTSTRKLDRLPTIQRIQQTLRRLDAPIQTVKVYAWLTGQPDPIWSEAFPLTIPPRKPRVQPPRSSHPTSRRRQTLPRWLAEKPDPIACFTFLQSNFSAFRLTGIAILALYGWFGSPAYTVENFLEGSNAIMGFLHGVNLIFHEAGHTIFSPFGEFLHMLGGSLNQILIPAIISGYFFFTHQKYAAAVALCWVAENFWDVSIYIKDAQERSLPLLGGEGVLHDWHFLLLDLRLLPYDQAVGNTVYTIGSLLYLAAIAIGIYYSRKPTAPSNTSLE
ncbi:MAG: hypothetical protein KME16_17360 [Scytolyngbya sp. HA4215-MV1]|jgi:hypothetical protein|nr:hypothetical protein [Scytolyngbya sp. HA4215-MV1]